MVDEYTKNLIYKLSDEFTGLCRLSANDSNFSEQLKNYLTIRIRAFNKQNFNFDNIGSIEIKLKVMILLIDDINLFFKIHEIENNLEKQLNDLKDRIDSIITIFKLMEE